MMREESTWCNFFHQGDTEMQKFRERTALSKYLTPMTSDRIHAVLHSIYTQLLTQVSSRMSCFRQRLFVSLCTCAAMTSDRRQNAFSSLADAVLYIFAVCGKSSLTVRTATCACFFTVLNVERVGYFCMGA